MKKNEYMDELRRMADIDEEENREQRKEQPEEQTEEQPEEQTKEQPEEPLDTEGSIECSVRIHKKDMRNFLFHHTYSRFSGWFGVLISLAALVMIIIGRNTYSGVEIIILAVLALLFTVVRPLQIVQQAGRQVTKQEMFQKPMQYNICRDGIVIRQGEQFANVTWEQIRNVIDTKKAIYVYTSPIMAFIIPKDQVSNAKEILDRIKENTGK